VSFTIHCGDCLDVLPTLEPGSVDLILTDPPYYRVKGDDWDRQWPTAAAFINWLGKVADEFKRVLSPSGSLYLFASVEMAARVECMLAERFEVLNSIRWVKPSSMANRSHKADLRRYFSSSEAVIFCEQRGADSMALGESGYAAQCERLRGFVFEPLRAYLDGERVRAGVDKVACNVACGFSATPGGMAARHYFSRSQWWLPTPGHYEALRQLFNASGGEYLRREYEHLRREYEHLRREYEHLRREYEDLRRPFTVSADVPYTDAWTFETVGAYPGKHPCEKPQALLRHAILASSRPGDLVLDAFAGGGSCGRAALAEGRRFVGIEKDPHWAEVARAACERPHVRQSLRKSAATSPAQGSLF